jgi:hypothetical protein
MGFECRARDSEIGYGERRGGLGRINVAQLIPIEKRIALFGKGSACGERRILVKYCPGPSIARECDD